MSNSSWEIKSVAGYPRCDEGRKCSFSDHYLENLKTTTPGNLNSRSTGKDTRIFIIIPFSDSYLSYQTIDWSPAKLH